jgi:hypothetical protein
MWERFLQQCGLRVIVHKRLHIPQLNGDAFYRQEILAAMHMVLAYLNENSWKNHGFKQKMS